MDGQLILIISIFALYIIAGALYAESIYDESLDDDGFDVFIVGILGAFWPLSILCDIMLKE